MSKNTPAGELVKKLGLGPVTPASIAALLKKVEAQSQSQSQSESQPQPQPQSQSQSSAESSESGKSSEASAVPGPVTRESRPVQVKGTRGSTRTRRAPVKIQPILPLPPPKKVKLQDALAPGAAPEPRIKLHRPLQPLAFKRPVRPLPVAPPVATPAVAPLSEYTPSARKKERAQKHEPGITMALRTDATTSYEPVPELDRLWEQHWQRFAQSRVPTLRLRLHNRYLPVTRSVTRASRIRNMPRASRSRPSSTAGTAGTETYSESDGQTA